jgi:hypothetical protein
MADENTQLVPRTGQFPALAFQLRAELERIRDEMDGSINEIIRTTQLEADLLKEASKKASKSLHNTTDFLNKKIGE